MAGKTRPWLRYSSLIGLGLLGASACLNPQSDDLPSHANLGSPTTPDPAATGTSPSNAPGGNLMGDPVQQPTGSTMGSPPPVTTPSAGSGGGTSAPADAGAPDSDGGVDLDLGGEEDPNVVQ